MPLSSRKPRASQETLRTAEDLRHLLSRWVRATREQTGTPSSASIETLRILHDEGPAPIVTLADRRLVKHQSMRSVVEQLATEKMVQKIVDTSDRRNQIVSITEKGRAVLKKEQSIRARWIAQLLKGCSSEEMDQVLAAMSTLERLLDKAPSKVPF